MKLTKYESTLFNPKRFMIATILYLRGSMTMGELRVFTKLTWGDLDSNIRYMEKYGLVKTRRTITREGIRTIVELTIEGERAYRDLVEKLDNILKDVRSDRSQNI